jgi:hypothetical protein
VPLDPRIPLSAVGIQLQDPQEVLAQQANLRTTQLQQQAAQGQLQDQQAARDRLVKLQQRQGEIDEAVRYATVIDPDSGLPRIEPSKLVGHLDAALVPTVMKQYYEDIESGNKVLSSTLALGELRQKHLLGSAKTIAAANYDPQTFRVEVRASQKLHAITQEQANELLMIDDPAKIKAIVDQTIKNAEPARAPITVQTTDDQGNNVTKIVPNEPGASYPNQPKPVEHSPIYKEWEDYRATGGPLPFDQYQTMDANRRRSVTSINTGTATVPGDFTRTGEAFLVTIPPQWRATVKKIANYDEDPTKVASMRGGMRETLMQWVNQVNPAYDASMSANRIPTRKAFTTGTQGRQINNINTAIGHIDQLTALADQLQNGGFVPANSAWNAIRTAFGADTVTNFETLKDALAGEVAGVLSGSGATVSGIAEARDKIHAASSPTQLAGYVATLIPVMGSKLGSLDYQYHQAMGADDPFSALSPESVRILQKHGVDPSHLTQQTGAPPPPAEGTEGTVNGVPAVWKTVNGQAGWYAK